ncbi:MAG: hypothetical protein ABR585_13910 [Gemmatimonadaceae bacterium]
MKRTFFRLTMVALLAGCETSANPIDALFGNGNNVLTQAQASGSWSFTLQRTNTFSCPAGSLPNGQVLTTQIAAATDGTVSTSTSTWRDPSGNTRPLSGSISLATGITRLTFGAGNTAAGMELRGTMTSAGSFSGTVTDPEAGLAFMFSSGCEYTATGTKTA